MRKLIHDFGESRRESRCDLGSGGGQLKDLCMTSEIESYNSRKPLGDIAGRLLCCSPSGIDLQVLFIPDSGGLLLVFLSSRLLCRSAVIMFTCFPCQRLLSTNLVPGWTDTFRHAAYFGVAFTFLIQTKHLLFFLQKKAYK